MFPREFLQHSQRIWANLLIRTLLCRQQLPPVVDMIRQQIADRFAHFQPLQREALLTMAIVRGSAETLQERGATFGWTYAMVEEMRVPLTKGLLALIQTRSLAAATADLDQFCRKYEARLTRSQGPFPGCTSCLAKCVYRADVRYLLQTVEKAWIEEEMTASYSTEPDRYTAIAQTARGIAKRWLGDENAFVSQVGFCGALHTVSHGYAQYMQEQFANLLAPHIT